MFCHFSTDSCLAWNSGRQALRWARSKDKTGTTALLTGSQKKISNILPWTTVTTTTKIWKHDTTAINKSAVTNYAIIIMPFVTNEQICYKGCQYSNITNMFSFSTLVRACVHACVCVCVCAYVCVCLHVFVFSPVPVICDSSSTTMQYKNSPL